MELQWNLTRSAGFKKYFASKRHPQRQYEFPKTIHCCLSSTEMVLNCRYLPARRNDEKKKNDIYTYALFTTPTDSSDCMVFRNEKTQNSMYIALLHVNVNSISMIPLLIHVTIPFRPNLFSTCSLLLVYLPGIARYHPLMHMLPLNLFCNL